MSVLDLRGWLCRRLSKLALVAATACALGASARAQLLFGPPVSTSLGGSAAMSVAAGDVDGDLFADLVIGHAGAPGLRLGDGTGLFTPETPIALGASGSTVLLADGNDDSIPDLFVGSSLTGLLHVARCDGSGGFTAADSYPLGPTNPSNTLSLDVRGPSVLALTAGAIGGSAGEARVFRIVGNGTLELTGVLTPASPNRIVGGRVGSLNGDEWPDVVLQLDAGTTSPVLTVAAYVGQPGGTFLPTWSLGGAVLGRLGFVGIGGSGLGLVTLASTGGVTRVTSYRGVGDGTFVSAATSELARGVFSICGWSDLNQDYINDLVAVRQVPAELWVMHGNGLGEFEPNSRVTLAPGNPLLAAGAGLLGDFDEGGGPLNFDAIVPLGLGTPTSSVSVCFNRTYFDNQRLDLGHQIKGTHWPIQLVEGSFVAGQPFSFRLSGAVPFGSAFLVAGPSLLGAPFQFGTMLPNPFLIAGEGGASVPNPFVIAGPFPVSAGGELALSGAAWTGGPSGLELFVQFWIADPAGPGGIAASSGVRVTLP